MDHEFIENELIILSKATLDSFLKSQCPADLIALYVFYYYTAKWQQTNQIKATTGYVSKGLGWGEDRVIRTKKILNVLGLIEDIKEKGTNDGKIEGWYIRLKYLWKNKTLQQSNHTRQIPPSGYHHPVESKGTNALSANSLNALSANKGTATASPVAEKSLKSSRGTEAVEDDVTVVPDDELVPTRRLQRQEAIEKGYKGHLIRPLREWAENRLGFKFTTRAKQDAAISKMLRVGHSMEDIQSKWSEMEKNEYWSNRGFDFMDVCNEIAKAKGTRVSSNFDRPVQDMVPL